MQSRLAWWRRPFTQPSALLAARFRHGREPGGKGGDRDVPESGQCGGVAFVVAVLATGASGWAWQATGGGDAARAKAADPPERTLRIHPRSRRPDPAGNLAATLPAALLIAGETLADARVIRFIFRTSPGSGDPAGGGDEDGRRGAFSIASSTVGNGRPLDCGPIGLARPSRFGRATRLLLTWSSRSPHPRTVTMLVPTADQSPGRYSRLKSSTSLAVVTAATFPGTCHPRWLSERAGRQGHAQLPGGWR